MKNGRKMQNSRKKQQVITKDYVYRLSGYNLKYYYLLFMFYMNAVLELISQQVKQAIPVYLINITVKPE